MPVVMSFCKDAYDIEGLSSLQYITFLQIDYLYIVNKVFIHFIKILVTEDKEFVYHKYVWFLHLRTIFLTDFF